jgi:hypothetical protein
VLAAPPANGHAAPARAEPVVATVHERVLYTTRRGQVVESVTRPGDGTHHNRITVETEEHRADLGDIEGRIDERGFAPGNEPSRDQLRAGLLRWGRIREVE